MRFPKHRSNMFIVMRETYNPSHIIYDSLRDAVPVGVFVNADAADDFRGACEQEFKEKGFDEENYHFSVVLSTFYEG